MDRNKIYKIGITASAFKKFLKQTGADIKEFTITDIEKFKKTLTNALMDGVLYYYEKTKTLLVEHESITFIMGRTKKGKMRRTEIDWIVIDFVLPRGEYSRRWRKIIENGKVLRKPKQIKILL